MALAIHKNEIKKGMKHPSVPKGRRKYLRNDFMGGHYDQCAEQVMNDLTNMALDSIQKQEPIN